MVKRLVLVVLLLWSLQVIVFGAGYGISVAASPSIIRVPYDCQTIQEAVDAANPEDIVLVSAGTYYEYVLVNKTISLVGESRETTIIEGGYVYVTADNVKIGEFSIQNGRGIFLNGSNGNIIHANRLTSNFGFSAVSLRGSSGNIISNNEILNNGGGGPGLAWGDGIGSEYSDSNLIVGNFISNNVAFGITLISSDGNIVANNTLTENGIAGLDLVSSSGNIISDNVVASNGAGGVGIRYSTKNTIGRNQIFNNEGNGIGVTESKMNVIEENIIAENMIGIGISHFSANNTFVGNTLSKNLNGIKIHLSNGSIIHHNNFINNTKNAPEDVYPNVNTWDDDYPSGGNYWSDYDGTDFNNGPHQNLTGSDGIGDTLHTLDPRNEDRFPFMGPISFFEAGAWNGTSCEVNVVGNSTVSDFRLNRIETVVSFTVAGFDSTVGFCRVTIPNVIVQDLWQNNYNVLVDGKQPLTINNWTDSTYTYLYFTYQHSKHEVVIIPEFPATVIPPLLMITLCAVILTKKRKS